MATETEKSGELLSSEKMKKQDENKEIAGIEETQAIGEKLREGFKEIELIRETLTKKNGERDGRLREAREARKLENMGDSNRSKLLRNMKDTKWQQPSK